MPHESERLLKLAARIADGSPVRWDDEEQAAVDAGERAAIRKLRNLAAIASYHGSDPAIPLPVSPHELRGRAWGPLRLVERIGEGATCEVWLAWDSRLERQVAVKLMRPNPAGRVRALREGRLLAKLSHPNVVTIHGAEEHDGRVGIWMEMIEGRTLQEIVLEHGTLSGREAALVGIEVCRALTAVHRAGLVHGDVKATNVMRAVGGRLVLMDFGCVHEAPVTEDQPSRGIAGTPLYIAPERFSGMPATRRSDLYAVGVLLFFLVSGRFPVEGKTAGELRERHERGERNLIQDLRNDLPESLVRALERALARDPRLRYTTAGELERALGLVVGGDRLPLSTEILLRARSGMGASGSRALVLGLGLVAILAIVVTIALLVR
jgi:serine/threonine protein kinase